jgi:hypothetical protein
VPIGASPRQTVSYLQQQIPENPAQFVGTTFVVQPEAQGQTKPKRKWIKKPNKHAIRRAKEKQLEARRINALKRAQLKRDADPEVYAKREASIQRKQANLMKHVIVERKVSK